LILWAAALAVALALGATACGGGEGDASESKTSSQTPDTPEVSGTADGGRDEVCVELAASVDFSSVFDGDLKLNPDTSLSGDAFPRQGCAWTADDGSTISYEFPAEDNNPDITSKSYAEAYDLLLTEVAPNGSLPTVEDSEPYVRELDGSSGGWTYGYEINTYAKYGLPFQSYVLYEDYMKSSCTFTVPKGLVTGTTDIAGAATTFQPYMLEKEASVLSLCTALKEEVKA